MILNEIALRNKQAIYKNQHLYDKASAAVRNMFQTYSFPSELRGDRPNIAPSSV